MSERGAAIRSVQSDRVGSWATLMVAGILVALTGILGRVIQLKVAPDARLAENAGATMSARNEVHRRGCLLDRRGRIIAASTIGHRLFVDPKVVIDPVAVATTLGRLLDTDASGIERVIREHPERRYVVIRDLLESWQVDALRAAGLGGVGLQQRMVRHYPQGDVAAAIVGMVGFEHTGLAGLEHRFDAQLQPSSGRVTYLRDVRRQPMWVEPTGYERGASGRDVQISIDLVIQQILERRLRRAVEEQNAAGGRAIVVDCRTGEILAMLDVLNGPVEGEDAADDDVRLAKNRCVTDPYEPGSTFKPFLWATATSMGLASPTDVLPTPAGPAYRTTEGRRIRDSTYVEDATWQVVLEKSINSGMAMVAERMTHGQVQDMVDRFGFGRRTRCGVPGESVGIVTGRDAWTHYTQTSVAMGHEIAVTIVQMARGFSVFARDGTLPALRLTRAEPSDDPFAYVNRVLSEPIVLTTREAMRRVVENNNHDVRSERYQLFGKSGTAQLPKAEGGGYHEDRYISSFIAGAPFDEPRLVVLCVIDDPDRSLGHFGAAVAGPVVRDVMDEALTYLGLAPDQP